MASNDPEFETKAAENVRYVEIRWGPSLHQRNGMSLAEGIAAVCRGAREAAARTGSTVRLICTAIRSHEPRAVAELAETAIRFRDEGLTGWDLAGAEAPYPDPDRTRSCHDGALSTAAVLLFSSFVAPMKT